MSLSDEVRNTRIDNHDSFDLADRISQLEQQLTDKQQALGYTNETLSACQNEIRGMAEEIQRLQQQLQGSVDVKESVEKDVKIDELIRKNQALQQQLDEYSSALDSSNPADWNKHLYKEIERLQQQVKERGERMVLMLKAINAFKDLISESEGVYGLHLNGDPAPWNELQAGGRYEEWLIYLEPNFSDLFNEDGTAK